MIYINVIAIILHIFSRVLLIYYPFQTSTWTSKFSIDCVCIHKYFGLLVLPTIKDKRTTQTLSYRYMDYWVLPDCPCITNAYCQYGPTVQTTAGFPFGHTGTSCSIWTPSHLGCPSGFDMPVQFHPFGAYLGPGYFAGRVGACTVDTQTVDTAYAYGTDNVVH